MKLYFLAFLVAAIVVPSCSLEQEACPAFPHRRTEETFPLRGSNHRHLSGSAIITNGVVKLGVNNLAQLNVAGGMASISGESDVGVRLITAGGEYESTSQGCSCEGWGASATVVDGLSSPSIEGYANNAAGIAGLALSSFVSTTDEATSVVTIGGKLQVTHHYTPSTETDNLYEVEVELKNIGSYPLTDLVGDA